MSVACERMYEATRRPAALRAWDDMQPHAYAWLRATLGSDDLVDFLAWFEMRVDAVVRAEGVMVFLSHARDGERIAHPYVAPSLRNKVGMLRLLLGVLARELPKTTLVVRTTHRASRRIRALLADVGFRFRGNCASHAWTPCDAESGMTRIPLEEWSIFL
jgi:hypothetical protein